MAQQDLILKTKFEKQIPYPILAEIAQAVKDRQQDESIYPENSVDLLEKVAAQSQLMEKKFLLFEVATTAELRPQALELIAMLIRFVKINTPE